MKIEFSAEMIGKKTDTAKIMVLLAVAALSVAMIAYTWSSDLDHTMRSYMLLSSLGYIGLLAVGIAAFSPKSYTTYAPTGSRIICRTVEFSVEDYDRVKELLTKGQMQALRSVGRGQGARMKLEMAYAKDRSFAAYQFFQYVPYEYVPATEVRFLEQGQIAAFCR